MNEPSYTIGQLSKRSGISVRRLRFYSDKGLLPPTARAPSGYRIYSGADLARLDLILALRDAGLSLDEIGKALSRNLAFGDVLKLRLQTLEAEIRAKRHIAAALRATLRIPQPTLQDLRRLWTVTSLSQAEFRAAIERFYDEVAEGAEMDPAWKKRMIDAGTPELPDEPTPEQIDAWTEIMTIISDQAYIQEVRAGMADMWSGEFDPAAYAAAADATLARVRTAIARGQTPGSAAGHSIAQGWLESAARAMKRNPDKAFLDWQLDQYRKYHSRSMRYQELLAILRGDDSSNSAGQEWRWIVEAMGHHL
ncbi:MAG: MerR family transcriptional regulator [Phreatobacter sp.]